MQKLLIKKNNNFKKQLLHYDHGNTHLSIGYDSTADAAMMPID